MSVNKKGNYHRKTIEKLTFRRSARSAFWREDDAWQNSNSTVCQPDRNSIFLYQTISPNELPGSQTLIHLEWALKCRHRWQEWLRFLLHCKEKICKTLQRNLASLSEFWKLLAVHFSELYSPMKSGLWHNCWSSNSCNMSLLIPSDVLITSLSAYYAKF